MIKKYAVIDYGSNSARLMIASVKNNKITTHYKTINTIRLGDGMDDGIITNGAMQRAKKATLEFIKIAEQEKVYKTYIFATSAVRDAKNVSDFTRYIKKNCGLDVDVISGDDEANIGYMGATENYQGQAVGIIDIGGGSTEIVFGKKGHITYYKSFVMGIVRLLQKYQSASPKNPKAYTDCENDIDTVFSTLPKELMGKKWLGIGGTATALAAMHLKLEVYDAKKVDGYYMPISLVKDMAQTMKLQTIKQRKKLTGLEEKRADVIVFGAIMLYQFLKIVGANGVTACESDNLEGYLLNKITEQ
jgi:exopolyphosphatase / guanosine-5'-triphosphate,3'-diphosphate pyrophosphatase